ncbi:FAD-dependent oxidoreductase [Natronorubrum tibetense]|uniref:FAD-dependent pyridine nucleotide-disulfide oxidoreductase n=1 Tax=Natronorubrum tibetense GA33 TaxID=1114856 RepID=L9VSY2_9EURY|nr:FAD-dependent oxidoreductase [Natronorubrum tibetense]ELY40310.1 FAD-dependent pyridine nucleotide-disulfide oxidoreductase [Natronorubrum tibetense GA33]
MTDIFVVVGGDAAGMSAASKAKRDDPDLEVVVFEKGEWVSYGACGLPYYVKGEIQSLEALVSVTPEEFREERDIDLRTGHEVVAIDPDERTVTAESESGSVVQSYDHLLLATGAEAVVPPIDGIDREGVYTLGSMSDGKELREYVARAREGESLQQPDRGPACRYLEDCTGPVGIVGGGYIGLEMAEALAANGFEVHLFQRGDRVLTGFSEATSEAVADHLREQDVVVYLESEVVALEGGEADEDEEKDSAVETVVAADERVDVEMVLVGTGVRPRTDLAEAAGIDLGPTGAVATDAYRETNVPDVYAAGDCAEATHTVTGDPVYVPLALTANRHGRAIGQTVAGQLTEGGAVAGTAAVKAFEVEAARTGILDHDDAREAGFEPVTETIDAKSRAGYYPKGGTVTVTLTADRDSGRVLGASLVSEYGEGAVHRSHAIVGALEAEATVFELENYDLAYAPPFNTTWDPVLVAAKVLAGKLR